ncbi:hypothetical protein MMC14_006163 [Varicellaria rhodocarpa]|nr:hypothetical protein [Varicellaria rhodocarpa]
MSRAPLIVPAVKKHTATVIFAHGLGDSGAGWKDLASQWRRQQKFEHVKFVFPNAPSIPITVNFGMAMPGWYDILSFDDLQGRSHDETGILKSREYFSSLINDEVTSGVPESRIVLGETPPQSLHPPPYPSTNPHPFTPPLGGFSQGGAISLFTGLTGPHKLAGFFGLSSYLLMHDRIKDVIAETTPAPDKAVPIFMGHGDSDPLVKYAWGQKTAQVIQEMGWKVDFRTYG